MTDRAQSEVTGVAFLTGVVVVVALVVGAFVIADAGETDDGPTADLLVDVSAENVTLTHNGGKPLVLADLRVVLRTDATERSFGPAPTNVTGGDATLDPGERIRRTHGVSPGALTVVVVHDPSNTVVADERVTVPD